MITNRHQTPISPDKMQKSPKKVEDFYHYYPKTDDWAVNFTNGKALPLEEIKQYFSKWGTIKNVRQTGSTGTGYCFVHFESEESARNCSIGMKNEFCVRLRPFLDRPRHVPSDKVEDNVGLHGEVLDFSFKKRETVEDTSNHLNIPERTNDLRKDQQKIHEDSSKFNQSQTSDLNSSKTIVDSQEIPKCVPEINGDSNSSTLRSKTKNGNPIAPLRRPHLKNLHVSAINRKLNDPLTTADKQKDLNSSGVDDNLGKFEENGQLMAGEANSSSSNSGVDSHSSDHGKIVRYAGVAPIATEELAQSIQKGITGLVKAPAFRGDPTFFSSALALEHPDVVDCVEAEEIVVANIPEFCDIDFLLTLFQRYEPIYITDIKLIHMNSIRYCHVYFQNRLDAQAVESLYDNLEISGKKLIVMRAENLIDEASRY